MKNLGRDWNAVFASVIICEAVSNDKLQIDSGLEIAGWELLLVAVTVVVVFFSTETNETSLVVIVEV
jgi:hypothetical protein